MLHAINGLVVSTIVSKRTLVVGRTKKNQHVSTVEADFCSTRCRA